MGNEWEVKEDKGLTAVLAKQSAAPREILELTVCRCRASKCSRRNCKCVANGLNCTSACTCEADRELCENELNNQDSSDSVMTQWLKKIFKDEKFEDPGYQFSELN